MPGFTWLFFAGDMLAAVAFATSGALVASRQQLDVVGFLWLGVLTGVGGGTVRDLLLGVPVFWVQDPRYLIACLITAVMVYVAAPHVARRQRAALWADALGLAFVTVLGTAKGLDQGAGVLVAVVMGVVTGSVGGIIRDVIGGERSVVLRREIYVTAAASGALVYALAVRGGVPALAAGFAGFAVTFAVRGLALARGWTLPTRGGEARTP